MAAIKIPTHLSLHLDFELANGGSRMGGFLIDWFIKFIYIVIINFVILSSFDKLPFYVNIIFYLPFVFYSFLVEWYTQGQSIGKLITKTRVISADGLPASIYQLLTRWMFNMVDVFGISLLTIINPLFTSLLILSPLIGGFIIILTPKNQRLGDIAANTLVVYTSKSHVTLDHTIYKYAKKEEDYVPTYPEIMRLSDKDISKIQQLMERGDISQNEELIYKLSTHIQKVLKIKTKQSDMAFLKTLLSDYNYYAKLDSQTYV